jgi:hypothetical protein
MIDEKHVMLDLETWGTGPGCAIRSIGAVEFCPITGKLGDEFYANVTDASCLELGLIKDPGTVAWWSKPANRIAQDSLAKDQMPIGLAVEKFTKFYAAVQGEYLWSQGANFDEPILGHVYKVLKKRSPWKFSCSRDTRTAYHFGEAFGAGNYSSHTITRDGTYHNALDDAKHQAVCVVAAIQALTGKNGNGRKKLI